MKIKNLLLVFLLLTFIVGCSGDDDHTVVGGDDDINDGDNPSETLDYFPANQANYWTYFNESISDNAEMSGTSTETLSVANVNGNQITFTTAVEGETPGLITGALANGTLEKSVTKLLYSGDFGFLNFEGIDINIPFTDMVLLDSEAAEGDVLFTIEDQFSQEIEFGDFGNFEIDVEYTLNVTQGEHFDSYMDFEDVRTSTLTFSNISVIAHGIPVIGSLELMESTTNEPMVSTNYFAEGIGLVNNETSIDIPFVDLEEIVPLPLPGLPALEPIEAFMTQIITDYSVN